MNDEKPKKKSGPSGPSKTWAARQDAGLVMLSMWLSAEAAADLAALQDHWKCTKKQAVEDALRKARNRIK